MMNIIVMFRLGTLLILHGHCEFKLYLIDKCNIELFQEVAEKEKSKLKNIAKRIIKKPSGYNNMESDLKYWAKQYNTSIYELELSNMEYPEELE